MVNRFPFVQAGPQSSGFLSEDLHLSGHSLDRRGLPTGCGLGLAGLYGTTTLEHDM